MAELIRAGLVADHGTQGRALTVAGRNVLREAARPLPHASDGA